MKAFLFNIFIFFCMVNHAVAQDFTSKFEQIVQKMIDEPNWAWDFIRDMNAENLSDSLIPLLKQYESFPNSNVQYNIYRSYLKYGMASADIAFKKQMMCHLLTACSCPDSIKFPHTCYQSIMFLRNFENSLFDQTMIDTINERVKKDNRYSLDYAYLSGRLYQYQMMPVFEELLNKEKYEEGKYRWHIILSRLGHEQSIEIVKDSLQKEFIWDRVRRESTFTYIRQKPVVDILFNDLESDEKESYQEQGMEKPLVWPHAYKPLRILAKIVKDFPIQDENVSLEKLEIARAWAREHREDYEIIKE